MKKNKLIKVSDYIINFLIEQEVKHIFLFVGGSIAHIVDSLHTRKDIKTIVVHHEQAGAFAAEGYSRVGRNLGVAVATSGPGATNMITGIGSAFFDSIPCLYITGQVNTYEYKNQRPIRQAGFQETDVVSIVKPITKYAVMVTEAKEIKYHLQKAVYLAKNGRPGPVLIDIPLNIQRAYINPDKIKNFIPKRTPEQYLVLDKVIKILNSSQRPVVLAGGGVRISGAEAELDKFIKKTGIPVVGSLMGLDAYPHTEPEYSGMIGAYGNRFANFTVANSDFLLVIGSRLDTRQTGTVPQNFARAAKIIHVDIDSNELKYNKIKTHLNIKSDASFFLEELNKRIVDIQLPDFTDWVNRVETYKKKYPSYSVKERNGYIDPNYFLELLSYNTKEGDIICTDVGQNQIWAAQSFVLKKKQRMLTSGGMGSMGFSLPAALGAYFSGRRDNNVIVITGDGGFQINIQELQTVVRNRVPVKIFLLNNNCLGMVRQFQQIYFNRHYTATVIGYSNPDFQKVVKAYGINTSKIKDIISAEKMIKNALSSNKPEFVEVILDMKSIVDPKLLVNRPIEDQSPFLPRRELVSNMLIDIVK
ncbi:MAG: Acetolactate synthase large subunit [Elusimicrobia bacterium ADurb.Bin231]|nr:MAG: Acetolactate synthase large subunit [Elusimicrobia bacterium ADurb.Bin231]